MSENKGWEILKIVLNFVQGTLLIAIAILSIVRLATGDYDDEYELDYDEE